MMLNASLASLSTASEDIDQRGLSMSSTKSSDVMCIDSPSAGRAKRSPQRSRSSRISRLAAHRNSPSSHELKAHPQQVNQL
eukprot:2560984-Amphidinium_carterae.1